MHSARSHLHNNALLYQQHSVITDYSVPSALITKEILISSGKQSISYCIYTATVPQGRWGIHGQHHSVQVSGRSQGAHWCWQCPELSGHSVQELSKVIIYSIIILVCSLSLNVLVYMAVWWWQYTWTKTVHTHLSAIYPLLVITVIFIITHFTIHLCASVKEYRAIACLLFYYYYYSK